MGRRTVLLLVAVLIAALGTAMIVMYVQGIDERATEGQELVEVLTATETIELGESIEDAQEAGKIESTEVVRESVADGALSSTSSIEGQVALGTIFPGEQIISQKFGEAGEQSDLGIPNNLLAISVELTDPERVAGFVNPGSEVAIFYSTDPIGIKADGTEVTLSTSTRILEPRIEVIGVGGTTVTSTTTKTAEGEETTEVPRTILTVAATQEQAERIIFGSRNGDLSFALRGDDARVTDKEGVYMSDLLPELFRRVQALLGNLP